ncbi:hypothetical protein D0C36_21665 [Mucilaginibacter conchicola]|uniref:Uncharacterized protein n=1 Tax=Mucilaginibacter conchicola TaxID=2303333 RepID=A0A372NQ73_9SPHI|nr:hypothetical protein [Mucilaginibacter conchicola]RFZ90403.1 hypothetical protein D0C36_21665 [Mucilaginibacter conchicola]
MDKNFYQKGFFEKKWFFITDSGLSVRSKKMGSIHEYDINFEDIGTRLRTSTKDIAALRLIAIACLVIAIVVFVARLSGKHVENWAEAFYLIVAVGAASAYYLTYKKLLYLLKPNNSNPIEFLLDKPTAADLGAFIELLGSTRRTHLLKLYGQLNPKLSYQQQYNNLLWLMNIEVITQAEFHEKISRLDKAFPATTSVKGFAFGSN